MKNINKNHSINEFITEILKSFGTADRNIVGNNLIGKIIKLGFINNPNIKLNITSISKELSINHNTARKHLEYFRDKGLLIEIDEGRNRFFQLNPEYNREDSKK